MRVITENRNSFIPGGAEEQAVPSIRGLYVHDGGCC